MKNKRQIARANKRAQKQAAMRRPGFKSKYARKREFLNRYNNRVTPEEEPRMGFDFPIGSKPWKA